MKETEKIKGKGFVIINSKDKIKDTLIDKITNIISNSNEYEDETVITSMAHYGSKIKISARNSGNKGRNVRNVLEEVINKTGGEILENEFTTGAMISQEKEEEFINTLKKNLEIEMVKIR
jgi:RNA binding exosome subunit